MRLFTGLSLPPDIIANLRAAIPDQDGVPPENLHITTKFIGEWPPARLQELVEALEAIPRTGAISIEISGFGHFQHSLFARVVPSPELELLAIRTQSALARLGLEMEKRPYTPHVTLAKSANWVRLAEREQPRFGSFEAGEFHLYESKKSVYSKLRTISLK